MSFQEGLGVGPECYVSVVFSRAMCGLLEFKTANIGQSCIYSSLLDDEENSNGDPYIAFCNYPEQDAQYSFTLCESENNVTDCGIDVTSK
jgi:hypothetical protein